MNENATKAQGSQSTEATTSSTMSEIASAFEDR
jgi:hypothetical protein